VILLEKPGAPKGIEKQKRAMSGAGGAPW